MKKNIEIHCLNTQQKVCFPQGATLQEIFDKIQPKLKYDALGARVNNSIEEMDFRVFKNKTIEFFDLTNTDGYRMYTRALSFVLQVAVRKLYPNAIVKTEHSISQGLFCEIDNIEAELTPQMVSDIEYEMRKLTSANLPFIRTELPVNEAIDIFREKGFHDRAILFETCPEFYTSIYHLEDEIDYFYGYLIPSTGYLRFFDLVQYYDGILLRLPQQKNPEKLNEIIPQDKLYGIFREHKNWARILEASTIGMINQAVVNNHEGELIKINEALHEKKLAQIADMICCRKTPIKLILIAGPSSSGKTTFCKRLAIQLKVAGMKPIQLSMDDYFVNRDDTPRDEHGELDFESPHAVDIDLFHQNISELIAGREVEIPKFSFTDGKRFYDGSKLKMEPEHVLLVEGIHALNPMLSEHLEQDRIFKIYVSALTQIGIDSRNHISTTDNRLIRRIVRDHRYRGYSALDTLQRWQSVRRGEEKYIFPFQEQADVMFNSALIYELSVLKSYAEKVLKEVIPLQPKFSEAQRLLKFLSYFRPIEHAEIPPTSIIREFLTGSTFKY